MTRRADIHARARGLVLTRPWAVALAVVLAGLSGGCRRDVEAAADVLTVAIVSSPGRGVDGLDPRIGIDEVSQKIQQLLYNSLARVDDDLRVVPELATGWDQPDDRTYRVYLRRGVRFHDGHELTSRDVVATFSAFLDPGFVSPRKGAYRLVESIVADGPETVVFQLKEPFGSFPVNLVMGIVSADSKGQAGRPPAGTGPYQFVSLAVDDRVVLSPFADHYQGPPRNAGIVMRVVPDDTMRGLELRKGAVDLVINDLAPDLVHQLQVEHRVQVASAPGTDYAYVAMNLRDPLLADVRVRRALAHAIDRRAIVDYLRRGLAEPAVGIVPRTSWAFEPATPVFDYDPARSKALLDEAGHRDPDGEGPQPRFRLKLKVSTVEFSRLQAAVVQENLRRVGVELEVRTSEQATFLADVARGAFQMASAQWVGATDPDMLRRVFHSTQTPPTGFNRGFFPSADVDRALDAATTAVDQDERRRAYGRAQVLIADQAPYISLWCKTNVAAFQHSLRGVRLTPTADFSMLRNVYKERGSRAAAAASHVSHALRSAS